MSRSKPRQVIRRTYSLIDEIAASPCEPLSADRRRHQLSRMWQGLRALETAPAPMIADWRICSDALNLMETLLRGGEARPRRPGRRALQLVARLQRRLGSGRGPR